ncbi:MAG: biotin--[acetyl-CoA-carboxylase] ligase [Nitrospirota bacterium]|jgi:BirA family biotin operon repressor/biotin-[acetyl-CoA-carboxylase] ligase
MKASHSEPLLRIFLRDREKHHSGEALGRALGVSRAALWKRVEALRGEGFSIEALPGKGYRLASAPDLSAREVRALLAAPHPVLLFDEVGSTNDVALARALGGAPHGTVVMAHGQSEGRGRRGRRWFSPRGENLYMSVVLRPRMAPREAGLLTLAAAVAAAGALREASGLDIRIKWPNDLVVSGRKLGGILLEMRTDPERVLTAVAGIGVNVNGAEFPPDIAPTATSLLLQSGRRFRRAPLAAAIANALIKELKALSEEGGGPLRTRWRALSCTRGRKVRVQSVEGTLEGTALDIDGEGRLLVRTPEGEVQSVSSGDVVMLR